MKETLPFDLPTTGSAALSPLIEKERAMQQIDIIRPPAAAKFWPMQTIRGLIRSWFSGRRGLIIGGIAVVVAGLALGWSWLSAIGVAPIILSLAPCAAMCAVGACAMMRGNASCAKPGTVEQSTLPEPTSPPAQSGDGL
jgi:hypothetical protein